MKKYLEYIIKFICLIMCVTTIFVSCVFQIHGEESDTVKIEGQFESFGKNVSWQYDFSRDYFKSDPNEYNHDLSRLSLGLSLSSFRDKTNPSDQGHYLVDYLEKLGFEQIEADSYHKEPEADSVAYGIARMVLDDATVIALTACGANYGPEWANNLTMGNEERSVGFADSSKKVETALYDYLKAHPAEGDLKLWIAGYSRGGAICNITAADMIDSGIFSDVYAYTFASPRTTRNPKDYRNIFNILQKNDIVTKIPFADWGYERYGIDLYLVSSEIDMDRVSISDTAEENYQKMVGSAMVRNYEINYHLRTLCDYMCALAPDAGTYTELLQPLIVDILTSDDTTKDALMVLLQALQHTSLQDEKYAQELKALRDYVGTLINTYYFQDRIGHLPIDKWDPQFDTYNLFNEHFPFEYLSYMYASDDPKQLFSDNAEYIRLVIYGNVDAEILKGDKLIKTIMSDGREFVDGKEAVNSLPDVECYDEKMVITLPADHGYSVTIRSKSVLPQTVTYTGVLFSGDTIHGLTDNLYSFLMNTGDTAHIIISGEGKAIEAMESDYLDVSEAVEAIYSPTTVMRLENNDVIHLTISGLVNKILFIIVLLIVQMMASIYLAHERKKEGSRRNPLAALIWHGAIALVFAILEFAMWYFVPILTIARFIPGFLTMITIIIYAYKGYSEYSRDLKTFIVFSVILILYKIMDSLFMGEYALWKEILILLIYAGFMFAAYVLLWKRDSNQKQ